MKKNLRWLHYSARGRSQCGALSEIIGISFNAPHRERGGGAINKDRCGAGKGGILRGLFLTAQKRQRTFFLKADEGGESSESVGEREKVRDVIKEPGDFF